MKKSFRPSKESRPSAPRPRPSAPRPIAPRITRKETFHAPNVGSINKESGFQSKEIGGGGKEFFGGNPNMRMPRRNRLFAIGGPILILICCLVGACAAVIYMLSQGILQLPGA